MAWSAVTLSTLNTIQKYEAEINQMSGRYTRPTLTLSPTGYLIFEPDFSSTDLTALYIDDTTEVLTKGITGFDIVTGGECVEIYETSSDNDYIFPTTAGSGTTIYDTTGTCYINITNSSKVAWNNAIIHYTWANKINIAKDKVKNAVKVQLAKIGWHDEDVDSDEIMDYITSSTPLVLPCDYLTLHLIYVDLFATQNTEAYETKADYYKTEYEKELQDCLHLLTLTIDGVVHKLFDAYGMRLQV